jgi:hypothetical protein
VRGLLADQEEGFVRTFKLTLMLPAMVVANDGLQSEAVDVMAGAPLPF